jgi:hypothetical protein
MAIIIGDDWTSMLYIAMRSRGSAVSQAYFIGVYTLGNLVLLNLFLATLINRFSEISEKLNEQEASEKVSESQHDWTLFILMKLINWINSMTLEIYARLKFFFNSAKRKLLFNDVVDKKSDIVKGYIQKIKEKKQIAQERRRENELRMHRAKNRFASKILNLQDLASNNVNPNDSGDFESNRQRKRGIEKFGKISSFDKANIP